MKTTQRAALVAALFLSGCGTLGSLAPGFMQPNWSVYRVSRVDPTKPEDDPTKFEFDRSYCETVEEQWRAQVAASDVVVSAGRGGLQNSSSLNPIAIGVGVVAGAADSAFAQSGLSISDERSQYISCVQYWTDKDLSAYVPNQR